MRNHGLKVLGLALLSALSMMAFAAVGAQAQLPGESKAGTFTVGGKAALLATVVGEQLGQGFLLVAARDLKIECSSFDINEGKINSSTDAQGKVTFLGCLSFSHAGVHLKDCQFKTLETITAEALILPILHGGLNYVLFEPIPPATIFSTPSYKSGTACTLPLNNPVTGSVTALVKTLEANPQVLLFSEAIQLLTGDKLAFGGFPAYLNATADVSASGAHVGQVIGVH